VKFVAERIGNISSTAIATEVGISPASVHHILTDSLGKGKVCTKWIPHVLDNEQRAMCCLHHYPSAVLETWWQ